jgi:hypothetical protein
MKMFGHLDDCFVKISNMISNEKSQFTPEQISDQ